MCQGRDLLGALFFAIALNFKHLNLYCAPAYFVYLLKHYCFVAAKGSTGKNWKCEFKRLPENKFSVLRFFILGATVSFVFAVSLGPFALWGQLSQLLSRFADDSSELNKDVEVVSIWARSVPCILGSKFLGVVQSIGQGACCM